MEPASNIVHFPVTGREKRQIATPLDAVQAHWRSLADGRMMPHRDELDPLTLVSWLDHLVLIDRAAPDRATVALSGPSLSDRLGRPLRGLSLTALFHAGDAPELTDALGALFDEPARILLRVSAGRQGGQMLMLPLRGADGSCCHALCVLDMRHGQGRLKIAGQSRKSIVGYAAHPPRRQKKGPDAMHPALKLVKG